MKKAVAENVSLKYVSLVTLTVQNALLGLSMRYARTRDGEMFLSSTAVLSAEVVKLITCLAIVYVQNGGFVALVEIIRAQIIDQPMDTFKVCVPSLVYLIQNNLLYVSASHLDAATYQVTYQLKILTTAMFAVLILKKQLLRTQWMSLVALVMGVVLVQLSDSGEAITSNVNTEHQNHLIGFSAALTACVLSGFAGIWFEKILKGGAEVSVWMRNVQLSLCSIPFGLISCYVYDGALVRERGFFYGYDRFVQYLIILQACGGLIVALVVKYADNILKGFATSLAIIISCVASMYLFAFQLTVQFALGAACVIFSIFLYGHVPKVKPLLASTGYNQTV